MERTGRQDGENAAAARDGGIEGAAGVNIEERPQRLVGAFKHRCTWACPVRRAGRTHGPASQRREALSYGRPGRASGARRRPGPKISMGPSRGPRSAGSCAPRCFAVLRGQNPVYSVYCRRPASLSTSPGAKSRGVTRHPGHPHPFARAPVCRGRTRVPGAPRPRRMRWRDARPPRATARGLVNLASAKLTSPRSEP